MITFVTLSGFLGAGKTTTMVRAAGLLERAGRRVVVITNDQGAGLVDTQVARSRVAGVGEVSGGCFCCRFEDLADTTVELVEAHGADVVIAEAVGSCTDITATVTRPLRAHYGDRFTVAPLTAITDPHRYRGFARAWDAGEESDLSYLFRHQLEDADVIALNKIDLLRPGEGDRVVAAIRERFPHAEVLAYTAARGDGLDALVARWTGVAATDAGRDLDLDYRRYADAEARLAWLNQRVDVRAAAGGDFSPRAWVERALASLSATCAHRGYTVGHVKMTLAAPAGTTKASLVAAGGQATFDEAAAGVVSGGTAVVNARVDCEPDELDAAVEAALAGADAALGTASRAGGERAFKPAEPRPTHRIAASGERSGV